MKMDTQKLIHLQDHPVCFASTPPIASRRRGEPIHRSTDSLIHRFTDLLIHLSLSLLLNFILCIVHTLAESFALNTLDKQ